MTLTRPLTQNPTAPPTFADAADRLDSLFICDYIFNADSFESVFAFISQ